MPHESLKGCEQIFVKQTLSLSWVCESTKQVQTSILRSVCRLNKFTHDLNLGKYVWITP